MATVIAEVRNSGLFRTRRMPIFQLTVGQGRSKLKCLWFNAAYLQDRFQPGQMLALYGKVEADRDGGLQIIQPQVEILGDINEEGGADEAEKKAAASLEIGRIVPIYESTGKLGASFAGRSRILAPIFPIPFRPLSVRISASRHREKLCGRFTGPTLAKVSPTCNRRALRRIFV